MTFHAKINHIISRNKSAYTKLSAFVNHMLFLKWDGQTELKKCFGNQSQYTLIMAMFYEKNKYYR